MPRRRRGRRGRTRLRDPAACSALNESAAGQRAERRGERAGEVVPGEDARAPRVADELRQRRLLDREEGADLVAARADHADDGGQLAGRSCA